MENVLFDNDWVSRSPDHFTYYTTCTRWRVVDHSWTHGYPFALAGYEAYIQSECTTGARFVTNTQVDHSRYVSLQPAIYIATILIGLFPGFR